MFQWMLTAVWLMTSPVHAQESVAVDTATQAVTLKTHNARANRVLNQALSNPTYWNDAWSKDYSNELYEVIRLKPFEGGYVPMIEGESDTDIPHEVVSDIIYLQNTKIPKHMSGAVAVVNLGSGHDSVVGEDYEDSYYYLDFGIFYSTYSQRMYRKYDAASKRTVLWFETLTPEMAGPENWASYEQQIEKVNQSVDKRWAFNAVIPFGEVFGMFIVSPGETRTSKVTFITKLSFGADAGWIAKMGSQMPSVIRSGLKSGYNACVAIAKIEKKKRAGA